MKRLLFGALGWAAGGALGWLVLRGINWGAAASAFDDLNWGIAVLAVAIATLANYLKSYRWKLLLPGEQVSTRRLFVVRTAGAGFSAVSPIRIVGESTQIALLHDRDGVPVPKILASMATSHLMDIIVTAVIMGLGLMTLPQLSGYWPLAFGVGAISIGSFVAGPRLVRLILRIPAVRRQGLVRETLFAIQETMSSRRLAASCFALTAAGWLLLGLAAWLVAQSMGIGLPVWTMTVVIVAIMRFAGMVPAPPGVVGVYEFIAVSALALFGVGQQAALGYALVIHALLYVPPILTAAAVALLERGTVAHMATALVPSVRRLGFGLPPAE